MPKKLSSKFPVRHGAAPIDGTDPARGIKNLAIAVVERAMMDLKSRPDDASIEWLFSDEPDLPFSLTWIADAIGCDPGRLRRRIENFVLRQRRG